MLLQLCKNARVQQSTTSLRERKRAETWAALHEAASTMVLEDGLHAVTVDAIAAQANVSPRTFFNYFRSKEDAILGLAEPELSEQTRLDFLAAPHDGQLLARTTRLLLAVARNSGGGAANRIRRREILDRYPELSQYRAETFGKIEAIVAGAVAERITAVTSRTPDPVAVEMLITLASTAVQLSVKRDPTFTTRDDVDDTLDDTVALLREVLLTS